MDQVRQYGWLVTARSSRGRRAWRAGPFGALAAAGIGSFGAQGVGSVSDGGQQVGEPTEITAIRSRTLMRVAALAAVGIGAAVLVMMQLFSTA